MQKFKDLLEAAKMGFEGKTNQEDEKRILNLIRSYDFYFNYIDDYKKLQKVQATNKKILEELKKLGVTKFTVADQTAVVNENLVEAKKMTLKDIEKLLKDEDKWADIGDFIKVIKGQLRIVDTWYYGEEKAMQFLKDEWTSKGGTYHDYFKEEYGVEFKLEEEFTQIRAEKEFKKITDDGIVGIFVTIK